MTGYVDCDACEAYMTRRVKVIARHVAYLTLADGGGEDEAQARMHRYRVLVHERHLNGESLEV